MRWDASLSVAGRVFVSLRSKRPEQRRFTLMVYDPAGAGAGAQAAPNNQDVPNKNAAGKGAVLVPHPTSTAPAVQPPCSPVQPPSTAPVLFEDDILQPLLTPLACPAPSSAQKQASSLPPADLPQQAAMPTAQAAGQIKASTVLRRTGIQCFADHELGCHLVRSLNDGHQVWAGKRRSFGLHKHARAAVATEEGLASLNSALASDAPFLYFTALLYYASVKAEVMGFRELFGHLEPYVPDPQARYRQVARAKYGCCDSSLPGGNGKCQAYFEGNVQVLRALPKLNMRLLYSGKLTVEDCEIPRIKRLARTDAIALPAFVKEGAQYVARLHALGCLNGILSGPPPPAPDTAVGGQTSAAARGRGRSAGSTEPHRKGEDAKNRNPVFPAVGGAASSRPRRPTSPLSAGKQRTAPKHGPTHTVLLPSVTVGVGILQQAPGISARSASALGQGGSARRNAGPDSQAKAGGLLPALVAPVRAQHLQAAIATQRTLSLRA